MKIMPDKKDRPFAAILLLVIFVASAVAFQQWAIAYLVGAIFLAALIAWVTWLTRCALTSNSWPTTPSRGACAYVVEKDDSNSDSKSFTLDVTYEYVVDEKIYNGTRFQFPFGIAVSVVTLRNRAGRINGTPSPPVYYDPRVPFACTLQPGLSFLDAIALVLFYPCATLVLFVLLCHVFFDMSLWFI